MLDLEIAVGPAPTRRRFMNIHLYGLREDAWLVCGLKMGDCDAARMTKKQRRGKKRLVSYSGCSSADADDTFLAAHDSAGVCTYCMCVLSFVCQMDRPRVVKWTLSMRRTGEIIAVK